MSRPPGFDPSRFSVAALIACAYIGASAWLIRGQGEAYRAQLRERRSALARDLEPPSPPKATTTASAVDVPPPEADRVETVSPAPAPTPPAPIEEHRSAPPPPVVVRAPALPAPKSARAAPALDPFWDQPEQKVVWDVDHMTIEDERRLGEALHQMVLHTHKPIEDGPLPRRVYEVGEPFLKSLAKPGLSYTFTVLDCDELNAFSHPGGYIYVCKGVFDWIGEDQDYVLGFLLAHEIAHVDLGHALDILRDPGVRALQAATVAKFYWPILPCGYKEAQDLEADRWAWKRMSQAGSTRREILAFLRRLDDYARRNGFDVKRRLPMEDPKIAPLDHHLRSHPVPRVRLKSLEDVMGPTP